MGMGAFKTNKRVCSKKRASNLGSSFALIAIAALTALSAGCQQPNSSGSTTGTSLAGVSTSNGTSTTTTTTTSSTVSAFQIITRADSLGSFDATSVPVSGGTYAKAVRLFDLNGGSISSGNTPSWFYESKAFLTSTRTSAGTPTYNGNDTACAYFDNYTSDINPDTSGYYTIDGYSPTTSVADINQCAGTAAAEQNQLSFYVRIDRRYLSSTDKLQIIVTAKALDEPNTSPTTSSCVVGGFFDATACSNQVFTVTLRSSPGAAAKPFYLLFPSAKALDLISETVLIPLSFDTSFTTISIDRVKGGAIIYGMKVIRIQ